MKKNLRFLFILPFFILCFQNKTIAQCWNNGDLTTYNRIGWDTASSTLNYNFFSVYNGSSLIIGGNYLIGGNNNYYLLFSSPDAIQNYLPTLGSAGALTESIADPIDNASGIFGGDVLALQLDVDFSDANALTGNSNTKFGDITLYGFTNMEPNYGNEDLTSLNGLTVRQYLVIVNALLGGGSSGGFSGANITDLERVTFDLTGAFEAGTPSTFAQQHLRKGWKSGDFTSYNQNNWGNGGSGNSILISHYGTVYASTAGGFLIGGLGGYTALWTDVSILSSYLPAVGGAAALTTNFTDGISTSSGLFGGDVAALKLNIDYADAGFLNGTASFHFGDLVLYGFTDLTELNGKTVREFLQTANTALGGGATTYTIIDIDLVLTQLNISFLNGTPSAWAQLHLKRGWQNGDLTTYNQALWHGTSITTASSLLEANFNTVYASNFGEMVVGGKYIMSFASAGAVEAYLPQTAAADTLDSSLGDPTFSASGSFGGEVVTLKLNVDFSDAGLITNNSGLKFGDLTICGFTTEGDNIIGSLTQSQVNALNGKTVRQLLNEMNIVLGAGTGTLGLTVTQLYWLAFELNRSFILGDPNGSPFGEFSSTFTQLHLVNGSCDCGNTVTNHCPTASAINISTTVGSAVKFLLQGSDADNNTLTYSISQAPVHGTATIVGGDSIRYTPASGYHGADQLKYKVSDGQCDAEATVNITVVVCPGGQGYWKNNKAVWPVTALMLGTISYTQAQLIKILNTAVGSGNNADASLILADQLIPAKLSVANGSPDPGHLADSIASADALIGGNLIPMKVKPNTALGKKMTSLATFLQSYNSGGLTNGCALPAVAVNSGNEIEVQITTGSYELEQNYPNPFSSETVISYRLPVATHVQLKIFNTLGQEVMTVVDAVQSEGVKTVQLNAANFSKGIYYYRLSAGTFSSVKKMILIK